MSGWHHTPASPGLARWRPSLPPPTLPLFITPEGTKAGGCKHGGEKNKHAQKNCRDVRFTPHPALASACMLASVTPSFRSAFLVNERKQGGPEGREDGQGQADKGGEEAMHKGHNPQDTMTSNFSRIPPLPVLGSWRPSRSLPALLLDSLSTQFHQCGDARERQNTTHSPTTRSNVRFFPHPASASAWTLASVTPFRSAPPDLSEKEGGCHGAKKRQREEKRQNDTDRKDASKSEPCHSQLAPELGNWRPLLPRPGLRPCLSFRNQQPRGAGDKAQAWKGRGEKEGNSRQDTHPQDAATSGVARTLQPPAHEYRGP